MNASGKTRRGSCRSVRRPLHCQLPTTQTFLKGQLRISLESIVGNSEDLINCTELISLPALDRAISPLKQRFFRRASLNTKLGDIRSKMLSFGDKSLES